ncbi:SRPBCC family protein [Gordonia sp. CPCC 206044]|uniref:SRPBCC family protein n=1 Tax=Gordonia sp. CPCC 206044 TaxID=3140793 RepID=UPI003AF3EEBB
MRQTYRARIADVSVLFESPADVTFDYLVDPEMRPEWQSSLQRIDRFAPVGRRPGGAGTTWTDVTVIPGVAPRMEVTEEMPPRTWTEIGRWWFVDARLTLDLNARSDRSTLVGAQVFVTVPVGLMPCVAPLKRVAPRVVHDDLDRAAAILGSDQSAV